MKKTVLLHGMHTSENFGDILLTQIMRDWLLEDRSMQVALLNPADVVATSLKLPKATFKDFLFSKAIILGGGGYFQRMDGHNGALKSIVKYALPLLIANLSGKNTAMLGIGASPMPRPWLDRIMALIISRVNIIVVRDRVGYTYMKQLLGNKANKSLFLATDLVFSIDKNWLPNDAKKWAAALCEKLNCSRILVLHLSEPSGKSELYSYIADCLVEKLNSLPDTGVFLIEDHPGSNNGQVKAQAEMVKKLTKIPVEAVPYPGVERLAALLAESEAVFTNKLHVGLCAAAMGTVPYSIAKHRKNLASFSDIGLDKNCLLLDSSSFEDIEKLISRFSSHKGDLEINPSVKQTAISIRTKIPEITL